MIVQRLIRWKKNTVLVQLCRKKDMLIWQERDHWVDYRCYIPNTQPDLPFIESRPDTNANSLSFLEFEFKESDLEEPSQTAYSAEQSDGSH